MLARLQKFTTFLLLAAAAAWAAWFLREGRPLHATFGALGIVFAHAAFLAIEFVVLWFVHGDDPAPRATPMQLFRAWRGEVMAAPRVFCWDQPFRSRRHPDRLRRGQRAMVLVHGFVCNRGLWNAWLRRLEASGASFIAVDLEPVFGSLDDYAPLVDAAVRRAEQATGHAPVLVGHSMGGLAIRAWMAAFAGGERVHRVVTIGSPHRGTWLARFGLSRNARQMAVASAWHQALQAREADAPFARFTCFYGHCDNVVFPASTATLPGADNRHVAGCAHVRLLGAPEVFDEALRWIAPARARTQA